MAEASIRGEKELIRALNGMERKVRNKILRTELKAGAKTLAEASKAIAPVGETGVIKRAIKVKSARTKKGQIGFNAEIAKGKNQTDDGWYGPFVDLGTKHQMAQQFMEKPFDQMADKLGEQIIERIWQGIEQAWGEGA